MTKAKSGNFFEDFALGQVLVHATPRTIGQGDVALYTALYGSRFAVQSSEVFARAIGYPTSPVDDLLVLHIVFGKTVPDISINAVANLGYAECRFLAPVFIGDTLSAVSEVIGLKENSNRQTGVVYVRTRGANQLGEPVVDYVRWVMVKKRDASGPTPQPHVPQVLDFASPRAFTALPLPTNMAAYDYVQSGASHRLGDYAIGEIINHLDGMTIEEAEHQLATRLYQNTAKVHFNQHMQAKSRFGRRLVYGGHVISLARALSFNGLENAFRILAINSGQHVAPAFAGDTIYAASVVIDKVELGNGLGALRLRLIGLKDQPLIDEAYKTEKGYDPAVLLDLDYWVLMPA